MARPPAAVSTYWIVPSSMRIPTRLFAPGTLLPAAAAGGMSRIESMRPVPARSGSAAAAATTTGAVPDWGTTTPGTAAADGGTTTAGAAAVDGGTTTAAAGAAGDTTTGAGAGATLDSVAHPARMAAAARERVKGSLLMAISYRRPSTSKTRSQPGTDHVYQRRKNQSSTESATEMIRQVTI